MLNRADHEIEKERIPAVIPYASDGTAEKSPRIFEVTGTDADIRAYITDLEDRLERAQSELGVAKREVELYRYDRQVRNGELVGEESISGSRHPRWKFWAR